MTKAAKLYQQLLSMDGKLKVEAQRCKILFTGEGRNGKTVLNGLMRTAAGDYGYDMPTHLLTTEVKSKSGPDQELTNCKDKRFCRGREPPKGTEFDFAKIKAYSRTRQTLIPKNCARSALSRTIRKV